MTNTQQLFFEKLINSARFEYLRGGEGSYEVLAGQSLPVVVRPYDIFSQLKQGAKSKIYFLKSQRTLIMQEGDAFYGPAGLPRQGTYLDSGLRVIRFALCRFSFFENLRLSHLFPDPFIIPATEGGIEIGEICMEIKKNINSTEKPLDRAIYIQKLAMELLLIVVQHANIDENFLANFPAPGTACFNALNYLEKNYSSPIKIDDLAKIACLSTSHFHLTFKTLTGFSPRNYLINLRLSKAQEQLLISDLPISAIAETVGWSDAFYFSRIFHAKLGISPSQYRERRNLSE